MGKRSDFARIARDFYPTPPEAVAPLIPHLPDVFSYTEPCAGDGALVDALPFGRCDWAGDIDPRREDIEQQDALETCDYTADYIITNPPWSRHILHPMIEHFSDMRPTWLLFDADWVHTKQAVPYLPRLRKIVSVGRVKWIKDSPHTGKDNCAWHLFTAPSDEPAQFYGRAHSQNPVRAGNRGSCLSTPARASARAGF